MNLKKTARCHIRMDSKWVHLSAVCMGLSVFIRTVYYFGLINLRDIGGFAVFSRVILPMVLAAGYLIMIKGFRLNAPVLFGGLISVYALNHLILMSKDAGGIISGILLVASAGVFLATGFGYVPDRRPLLICASTLAVFRLVIIDLAGYLLPLSGFDPVSYLPEASNLFGFLTVALLAPALQVTVLPCGEKEPAEAVTDVQESPLPTAE